MEILNKYWQEIVKIYKSLDNQKRIFILGGSVATVFLIVLLVRFTVNANYEVLFSGLDNSEAGTIVEKLREQNVSYQLKNGGTTIMVPSSKVYDLRLDMASQGLPQSGTVGYEIFDKNNIGVTDFIQKINFRRALEGELSRTISTFGEVNSARVHLVIPEQSLFVEDQKETTASITVKLKPGSSLAMRQIQAIGNLVAASVEGLHPNNVTIVDSNGNILAQPSGSSSLLSLSSNQMELKRNVENYYSERVKSLLENVVGKDRAAVQITVDLNFDQVEKTETKFDPDNVVVISEQKNVQTTGNTAEGTPDRTEDVTTNYEVNKTVQRIVQDIGSINRISVAAMVDGKYQVPPGAAEDTPPQYVPLTTNELNQLSDIVKSAVGFSQLRQDEVQVVNLPFDNSHLDQESKELASLEKRMFWENIAKRFFYLFLIALGGFTLWKFSKSFKKIFSFKEGGGPILSLDSGDENVNFEISPDIKNNVRLQQTISKLTKEKPGESAKLLKAWLVEDNKE